MKILIVPIFARLDRTKVGLSSLTVFSILLVPKRHLPSHVDMDTVGDIHGADNTVVRDFGLFEVELRGFIRALAPDPHVGDDLFQEVALVVFRKAGHTPPIRNFPAWAKEIARRKIKEYYRRKKGRAETRLPTEEMQEFLERTWDESEIDAEALRRMHEAVQHCLERLPGDSAAILTRRFAAGAAFAEIAAETGRTEAGMRRAISRIRLMVLDCARRFLAASEEGVLT